MVSPHATFAEFDLVAAQYDCRFSAACADMHDTVCRTRQLVTESRELMAKSDAILEAGGRLGPG